MVPVHLPEPLIIDIISRLPVKSLLRFRSVSKSWLSLIDSQQFIKLHLRRSVSNTANQAIILRAANYLSVDFPALDRAVEIDVPLRSRDCGGEILGSCNGLVCLQCFSKGKVEGNVICNPATKDHRELDSHYLPNIQFPRYFMWAEKMTHGFGYDEMNDDYKLFRIIQFNCMVDDMYENEVLVYSSKAGSWKRVNNHFPLDYYLSYKRSNGEYVNGCLHWVVTWKPKADGSKLIVALNVGTEKYNVVPQPVYPGDGGDFQINVGVLKGCLYVMCNHPGVRSDVWVWTEYGVKESWVKRFSVAQPEVMGVFNYVKPLAYSNDGSKVLLEQDVRRLVWFDLQRQTAETVNINGVPEGLEGEMLVESLVPLDRLIKNRKQKSKKTSPAPAGNATKSCDVVCEQSQKGSHNGKNKKERDDLKDFLTKGFKLKL